MVDKVGEQTLAVMSQAKFYNSWLYDLIKPYIVDDLIDIGAGVGTFTAKLVADFSQVAVADYNLDYLRPLQKRFPQISTHLIDLQSKHSPEIKKKYRCAIALNVVEHLTDVPLGLKNISQLLNKNAPLIILVPAGKFAYNNLDRQLGHNRRFTIASLTTQLQRAGFKPQFSRYLNFWGIWGWWLTGGLSAAKQIPLWEVKLFDLLFRPWLWLEKRLAPPIGLSVLCVAYKQ